jgi:polyisoprenoid-binding protein YceI
MDTETPRDMRYRVGTISSTTLFFVVAGLLPALGSAQVPAFKILVPESKITFHVKASVNLVGTFDKWDASLRFSSGNVESGVLEIKIQAASVNTGSGMKNCKLKSEDFFDVRRNPLITFLSRQITPIGPDKVRVGGDFTIRGVSRSETLTLSAVREGDGTEGRIEGEMAFDRKDYGMTHGIPFIKIADRVQVNVNLIAKRISGPPVEFKIKTATRQLPDMWRVIPAR